MIISAWGSSRRTQSEKVHDVRMDQWCWVYHLKSKSLMEKNKNDYTILSGCQWTKRDYNGEEVNFISLKLSYIIMIHYKSLYRHRIRFRRLRQLIAQGLESSCRCDRMSWSWACFFFYGRHHCFLVRAFHNLVLFAGTVWSRGACCCVVWVKWVLGPPSLNWLGLLTNRPPQTLRGRKAHAKFAS